MKNKTSLLQNINHESVLKKLFMRHRLFVLDDVKVRGAEDGVTQSCPWYLWAQLGRTLRGQSAGQSSRDELEAAGIHNLVGKKVREK